MLLWGFREASIRELHKRMRHPYGATSAFLQVDCANARKERRMRRSTRARRQSSISQFPRSVSGPRRRRCSSLSAGVGGLTGEAPSPGTGSSLPPCPPRLFVRAPAGVWGVPVSHRRGAWTPNLSPVPPRFRWQSPRPCLIGQRRKQRRGGWWGTRGPAIGSRQRVAVTWGRPRQPLSPGMGAEEQAGGREEI